MPSEEIPLSAKWVALFVASLDGALLGAIHEWRLVPEVDPLRWDLHLRLHRHWREEEIPIVRRLLKEWAEANDCVYRKSFYSRYEFRALIILKGLGPLREVDPLVREIDEANRRNR